MVSNLTKAFFVNMTAIFGWAFLFVVAYEYRMVWLAIVCWIFIPYHAYVIGLYVKDEE